jgi:hypothetical protein
MSSRLWSRR